MTLFEGKIGGKFMLKEIEDRNLDSRLLSFGLCRGDQFVIETKANGNILIKTLETKIVLSENLANKVRIEVLE